MARGRVYKAKLFQFEAYPAYHLLSFASLLDYLPFEINWTNENIVKDILTKIETCIGFPIWIVHISFHKPRDIILG